MLGRADDASGLHSFDVGEPFGRYIFRVFTERTVTDHRVEGVVVHVDRRGQVDVQSGAFGLTGYLKPHFIDQLVVFQRAQGHLVREIAHVVQAHAQPPFAVDSDKHRGFGDLLQTVGQGDCFGQRALEKYGAAYTQFLGVIQGFYYRSGIARTQFHEDHLSDLFFQRQCFEYRVHPGTVHVFDEFRILVLGRQGEETHRKDQ